MRLHYGVAVLLLVGTLVATSEQLLARQVATAPELKAAFLLNFARFTTWPGPALQPGAPLELCISGDTRVAQAAERLSEGQRIQDHPVTVRRVASGSADGCHLLYVAAASSVEEARALHEVARKPILTVGDSGHFIALGGIVAFFVDDQRMRFAVRPAAADRAGVRISSRLLTLARIVKEGADGHAR